ncbi:MAG: gamma-glutamyltransferase [Gemmatimonadetes bacterium]|nr:gamma-glutamyltransferase [Gemmatimonadota bacterium]
MSATPIGGPRPRPAVSALLFLSVLVAGCERGAPAPRTELPSTEKVARADRGMLSTASPLATAAGVRMFEAGGNAADAAVAASFALAVVEPSMSSLGGRMQVLAHDVDGTLRAIDATTQAPLAYDSDNAPEASYGYATIGIPGMVAGALEVHESWGALPLAQVMAPAIEYARRGFVLDEEVGGHIRSTAERLAESEGALAYFFKEDGTPYGPGDRLVQEDLARTLERIAAEGRSVFYEGAIAEQIVDDMEAHGGFVTLADLAQYRAVDSRVLRGSYRGYGLAGSDVPAGGGTVIEILHILENLDVPALDEEAWMAVVGQALVLGFEDYYGGVQLEEERADVLTSKEWAARRARAIRLPTSAAVTAGGLGLALPAGIPDFWSEHRHTTHLTAADADGRVIALTQSLGPAMGAKVAAPGLGFLYAATLGGYLGPIARGQRAGSAISPFLILQDERPRWALGAAGGLRIIAGVTEVASRLIDRGQSLPDAVAGARFFPNMSRSGPGPWELETSPVASWEASSALALLQALEIDAERNPNATSFSRVHAVGIEPDGTLWGVADPRWGGAAAGVMNEGGRP